MTSALPDSAHLPPGSRRVAFGIGVGAVTAFCVFVLPFFFPPHAVVRSQAFAAGFNNKIAEIAVGLLSLTVLAVYLRYGRSAEAFPVERLERSWMVAGVVVGVGMTLALGMTAIHAGVYFGESQYFLTQVQQSVGLHRTLYREVQFAYGPALYWGTAWLTRAGLPMMTAYVAVLAVMQAVGFALFYCVVDALPMPVGVKRFTYGALAVGSLSPSLGMNYSLFRFALPMAAMVLLGRSARWASAVAAGAVLAGFAVSAEAGVACVGGALAYAVYRRSAQVLAGTAAGVGLAVALLGRDYFLTLMEAGQGGFDLLLTPEPRTVMLLVAAVGMAPLAVARWVLAGRRETAGVVVALYGAALGALPVALGRCDAGHEFYFGLGCVLLSLVAVGRAAGPPAKVWLACVVCLVGMTQRANLTLHRHGLAVLRQEASAGGGDDEGINVDALERKLDGHAVTLVYGAPRRVTEALLAKKLVVPSFYCQLSGVWRAQDEQRKIADLRQGEYALTPGEGMTEPPLFGPQARWRGLLPYRQRREPFVPGRLIDREFTDNWVVVGWFGWYALLHKVR